MALFTGAFFVAQVSLIIVAKWKSHATLTLLAKQDLPTFGYNMIDPLKSWCWGQFYFTLLKFPVFLRP